RPDRTRDLSVGAVTPLASSCRRATTPCWAAARSAMTASMPVGRALDRIVPVAQGIDGISIDRCRRGRTALTGASGAGGEVVETPTKCWLRRWGGLLHRCTTPAGVAPGIERGDRTWTVRGALPWQDGATPTPRARRWKTHMGTSTTPPGLAGARR